MASPASGRARGPARQDRGPAAARGARQRGAAQARAPDTGGGTDELRLRILATTDLHAHLLPYDYYNDRPAENIGLLRVADLIAKARAETDNTLLLDNGDLLQGSPLGDLFAESGRVTPEAIHPMIAAMNALGFDAATLGNHDFNFGLDALALALSGARFPFVLGNLHPAGARRGAGAQAGSRAGTLALPSVAPYALIERSFRDRSGWCHRLTIGVTGLAPTRIMNWDRNHLAGRVEAEPVTTAARRVIAAMRAAGADIVVVLNHAGIGDGTSHDAEDTGLALARAADFDVQILGHSHRVFPAPDIPPRDGVDPVAGRVGGRPAVMPGANGSHLGVIDLVLAPADDASDCAAMPRRARAAPRWRVIRADVAARPVAGTALADPQLATAARDPHIATLGYIRRPVGHSDRTLHSYFSLIMPDRALRLAAEAQRTAVELFLRDKRIVSDHPVLSAVAPLKCGGQAGPDHYTDIPAGPIALRHCSDLYPFPNALRATRVTGATIADWLERAAAMFLTIRPGLSDQPLRNPDHAAYNFDIIDGLTYAIDLTAEPRYAPDGRLIDPARSRIRDIRQRGRPVKDSDVFIVASNSYRLQGGGGFPAAIGADVVLDTAIGARDVLIRYIARSTSVAPDPVPIWRFVPVPGASVIYDTGPGAAAHLADAAALSPEPLGLTEAGFLRLRIRL